MAQQQPVNWQTCSAFADFFLALWCSFVCSLLISYMTVFECFSLRENWRCLCHSPQFTPFWQVPQGCSHTNGAVYRQQLLSPGHTQVCVCSSRGISMAGSNPISLPELSAAGVDSKSSPSPDSSCCCLVLEHKWLIANLAPRQEQSAKLLFIEVFLCATSLSFLPSVRGGRWFCLCAYHFRFSFPCLSVSSLSPWAAQTPCPP